MEITPKVKAKVGWNYLIPLFFNHGPGKEKVWSQKYTWNFVSQYYGLMLITYLTSDKDTFSFSWKFRPMLSLTYLKSIFIFSYPSGISCAVYFLKMKESSVVTTPIVLQTTSINFGTKKAKLKLCISGRIMVF